VEEQAEREEELTSRQNEMKQKAAGAEYQVKSKILSKEKVGLKITGF